jgi:hypothetical protein
MKRFIIAMAKHHGIIFLPVIANTQNNQSLMIGVMAVKITQRKKSNGKKRYNWR